MNKQKTRPSETWKGSTSKMWRPRKLKLHQPGTLIRSLGLWSFSFLGFHILDLEHFKVLGCPFCGSPFLTQSAMMFHVLKYKTVQHIKHIWMLVIRKVPLKQIPRSIVLWMKECRRSFGSYSVGAFFLQLF